MAGRKIIHIDMDAFYASVEQRDAPHLRGRPLAVGGTGARGVIAAASYEARAFGVRSATSTAAAVRLCPDLVIVKPRFEVYRQVSERFRAILSQYTDAIEPLALDEAYLDVTDNKVGAPSATELAQQIRKRVQDELNLTCSAGVSYNKFLAKTASDLRKPNGLAVIRPEQALRFLERLPINRFFGIGPVTAERMRSLGIQLGFDLKQRSEAELVGWFGKAGHHYFQLVRGIDEREVEAHRQRKSIGAERTFAEDISTLSELTDEVHHLASRIFELMARSNNYGRTVTTKIKTTDFETSSKSVTQPFEVRTLASLQQTAETLLHALMVQSVAIRLLGVSVSNLSHEQRGGPVQLELFGDDTRHP